MILGSGPADRAEEMLAVANLVVRRRLLSAVADLHVLLIPRAPPAERGGHQLTATEYADHHKLHLPLLPQKHLFLERLELACEFGFDAGCDLLVGVALGLECP
jgi:hypothetical protein